nr:triose-phosphate isomerase [Paraflavitalea speifideiaquila]
MLHSIGIKYCVLGHSERREYFQESNQMLAGKLNICLEYGITPIFVVVNPSISVRPVHRIAMWKHN